MSKHLKQDFTAWKEGDRVARTDTHESGTVIEANGLIKVKWDNGRTSYYPNRSVVKIEASSEAAISNKGSGFNKAEGPAQNPGAATRVSG